ncbi:hypothetical protein GCM10027168_52220 [Streptomyces capparidis]
MADTSIRISAHARDRLARIAAEQGTTIRTVVETYAESTLTPSERAARAAAARDHMAAHFGAAFDDGDPDAARAEDLWRRAAAGQEPHAR